MGVSGRVDIELVLVYMGRSLGNRQLDVFVVKLGGQHAGGAVYVEPIVVIPDTVPVWVGKLGTEYWRVQTGAILAGLWPVVDDDAVGEVSVDIAVGAGNH